MKWEAEHETKLQRSAFDSDILSLLLTKFSPLAAWKLVSGEDEDEYDDEGLSNEALENRDHGPVPEIDEFSPENLDYMQGILDQFNLDGFALEELDG